jgi:branched-chain amino acid transport system permease protein
MLERVAPKGSITRKVLLGAGLVILLILYTQVYLVGDSRPGRGVPMAIVFQGFVVGSLNALTAAGLILIYRASRIINFAQGAIGVLGAVFVAHMVAYNSGFPFPITFIVGVAASAFVGAVLELTFGRRFAKASRLVLTVMTAAGAGFLAILGSSFVVRLGFFPPQAQRLGTDLDAARLRSLMPFSGFDFHVGSSAIRFGFPEVFALELALLSLIGLAVFFRYTRAGVAVRASSENAERAALLGIGVAGLGTTVWAIAGALSGINVTADVLLGDPSGLSRGTAALFIPVAAAILARMRNLPTAVFAALLIGIATSATEYTYSNSAPTINTALFIVVCVALLLQRRSMFRESQSEEESSWEATEEPRPIPTELRSIPAVRYSRWGLIAVGLIAAGVVPFIFATRLQVLFATTIVLTIAGLSLVVLTGWAGQMSLGQFGFVAVGAVVAGKLSADQGWSFWLCIPAAVIVTSIVAGIIGLPALRIRGLYLAAVTFGFAIAVDGLLSSPRYFRDDLPRQINRPTLFFLDFEEERSMYFLCLVCLVIAVLVVYNLRRSRFGRLLIASRENEINVQSFGVSLVRLKVLAFVASGALAGFAGGLYAYQQRAVTGGAFGIDRSFNLFITTIVGGISAPAGALLGSLYGNLSGYFFRGNLVFGFIVGLLPLALLYIEPGGLIAMANQLRDSWLRIIAQRRQIIVPSLFADYDPRALEKRLIPLVEPATGEGLAALPVGQRFSIESELYGDGHAGELEPPQRRESREIAAIAAASQVGED